jgi:purine-cytosine permease-like protein
MATKVLVCGSMVMLLLGVQCSVCTAGTADYAHYALHERMVATMASTVAGGAYLAAWWMCTGLLLNAVQNDALRRRAAKVC